MWYKNRRKWYKNWYNKRKKASEIAFRSQNLWQGQKDLNPRHVVLERQNEFVISCYPVFFVTNHQ